MALTRYALPHVGRLHAYTPGLQPKESGWIKLNTNECPYPPSPRVVEALSSALGDGGERLRLYPDPKSRLLREGVARHHGLGADQVCIGNGSDDILNLLVRCFCAPTEAAGFVMPGYSLYPVLVAIQDGRPVEVPLGDSLRLPLDRIAGLSARILFITSPNAPTGVAYSALEIAAVLEAFPGIVVIDEAYAPFADADAVELLARYARLVVVRTFSKAYALAGLRVGYALADAELIALLDRVRDSYNVNCLSQVAALSALEDKDYYAGVIARVRNTRDHYVAQWIRQGWSTYRSATNFIFTRPCDVNGATGPEVAKSLYEHLVARKILVRHFPNHALTAPYLRISVGTDGEMLALQTELEAWIKHA